jgi:hypothetical protein
VKPDPTPEISEDEPEAEPVEDAEEVAAEAPVGLTTPVLFFNNEFRIER